MADSDRHCDDIDVQKVTKKTKKRKRGSLGIMILLKWNLNNWFVLFIYFFYFNNKIFRCHLEYTTCSYFLGPYTSGSQYLVVEELLEKNLEIFLFLYVYISKISYIKGEYFII